MPFTGHKHGIHNARTSSTYMLSTRAPSFTNKAPTRRMRMLALATAESETVSQEQPTSDSATLDLQRPKNPPTVIYRAPPSPRTVSAKEKAQSEFVNQRKADRAARGDTRGGPPSSGDPRGPRRFGDNNQPGGGNGQFRPNNNYNGPNNSGGRPGGGYAGGGPNQQQQTSNQGSSNWRPGGGGGGGGGPGGPGGGGPGSATAARRGGRGNKFSTGRTPTGSKSWEKPKAIDIGSRRKSRQSRKQSRLEEARSNVKEREDIFEVGPEGMSVADLAEMLAVPPVEIVKKLFMKGIMVQVNSTLDSDTVKAVGHEYEVDVLDRDEARPEDLAKKSVDFIDDDDLDFLTTRPPVVTVMGHVDHGKTSLLDFIRKSKVAAGEAGGITQSIGAYTCDVDYLTEKRQVTFLDTPGHEAFSAMRARGARVTDIAIIIVAADDGVRPQTIEAISHANAAGVPIVVAINKTDKEGANIERVKQELTEQNLVPEEWGGKTPMVAISAKKGAGVDELLETVLLVAELEDLQANSDKLARGTVLEASLDKQQGPMATVLVQAGTLKQGDVIAAGGAFGKVRMMRTTTGEVTEAGPSIAVQVLGLNGVPQAGDELQSYEAEPEARAAAENVEAARRLERLAEMSGGGSIITLSSLASMDSESDGEIQQQDGNNNQAQALQRMNMLLKADASGSCEAVKAALGTLPQDTVKLRWLLTAPGEVTVSDVDLAAASGGLILAFNVNPSETVLAAAKRSGVDIRSYKVIYNLVDDVKAAMEGRLSSVEERIPIGTAEVKAVFGSGSRKAAGCLVTDGVLKKGCFIQVIRGRKTVVYEGTLNSLRRVKDDVKEVTSGTECGVTAEGYRDWEEGDRIQAFDVVQKKLSLEEARVATINDKIG